MIWLGLNLLASKIDKVACLVETGLAVDILNFLLEIDCNYSDAVSSNFSGGNVLQGLLCFELPRW